MVPAIQIRACARPSLASSQPRAPNLPSRRLSPFLSTVSSFFLLSGAESTALNTLCYDSGLPAAS